MDECRNLVATMVRAVVDLPDSVVIEEEEGESAVTFRIHVAPSDLGKAIGKQGRIANAMRVMVKATAMKHRHKVYLEVVGDPAEFGSDSEV